MVIDIDPKVDYAFKWLFGNEKNTRLLVHLLHAILNPTPEEQIVEIQILNPFSEKMALDDKLSILDIKARDQRGRQFNVEMQMLAAIALRQRVLYYWAQLYTEQLKPGEDYRELCQTISVCFIDDLVFPAIPDYHLAFRLLDPEHGVALTEDLRIHLFELPKFVRTVEELATPMEAWLYFLRKGGELDPEALPGPLDFPEIREAMEALKMLGQTDLQREIYEGRLKARRDERMRWYEATEQGLQRGLEQGLQRGLEQGRQEGLQQGLTKGALIGGIEVLRKLLGHPPLPRRDLESMDLSDLQRLEEELTRQLAQQ
jgi:predicted transposase/invertase (TIGR01784 family)